jgi:phytoene dehydrogenase-like protein
MRRARDSRCDNDSVSPTPGQQARAQAITAEITARLATVSFALPGTIADRLTRCGHANCRCHASPPQLHGPYHQWTRKKNGRTATKILSDEQLADYAPWFDNHKRIRELLTELEELSLTITDNDPRWNR